MNKFFLIALFYLLSFNLNSQITLTYNVGNTPTKTNSSFCLNEESWARVFTLSDFGISNTDQFIIKSAQVAVSNIHDGATLNFGVLVIDEDFPNFNDKYIGGGRIVTHQIGDTPEIIQIDFETQIVVPSKTKRILVVVSQDQNFGNPDYKKAIIAGTEKDKDFSWFQGCSTYYPYIRTDKLDFPAPNANFFINATGEKRSVINSKENTTLSHSIGDDLVTTSIPSCKGGLMNWARKFDLSEFGINSNEEYIIKSGDIGISGAGWLANVTFNIYKIDNNFPSSFSKSDLIGSSQKKVINPFSWNSTSSKIMKTDFETPITIPADVEMILVEVKRGIEYGDGLLFVSGTKQENDDSWYRGDCPFNTLNEYKTINQILSNPSNDINFYITVNGEVKTVFPFEITNDNDCDNRINNFSLTNQSEIKSVIWNFDDPTSGTNNTSTSIDVNHQFTDAGTYNVTAEVVHTDNTSYTIPKKIEIFESPNINSSVSLKQCDNSDIDGFSFFNLNEVKEKIISNPEDYTITFHEEKIDAENKGTAIANITNYKNEQVSIDKIWARVENSNGCFDISEVNLLVSTTQIPLNFSKSFYQCDDGTNTTDGIATFDFSEVNNDIINLFPANQQLEITYYRNEENALAELNKITDISNYQNTSSPNQQNIYIRVDSKTDNSCLGLGAHISLNVEKVPIASPVTINPECDNDRDGFYAFDTSTINTIIIGTQTNVAVTYFDENGTPLSSPLPNPFITASQNITARIVNTNSQDKDGQCFDETILSFIVNSVPIANAIAPQEECDDDFDGIISFDTSAIQGTILGAQTGLVVKYFDENNNILPSPLPNPFTTASQTIRVRLENPIYDVCFEETTIDFIVREKPTVNVIKEDIICMNANPQLQISVENPNSNYSYTWRDENNTVVGNSENTTISKGGIYSVTATSVYGCNSEEASITVKESSVSTIRITDLEIQDDSDNNFIKINTTNLGLGNYEFRLLDSNSNILFGYQDNLNFENLDGGNYIIEVNDKNGCGSIPFEVSLISFPKFFTPNGDGKNDIWQIKGLEKGFYKSGEIVIYNRYGNRITNFTINDVGWDGTYNGKILLSNDYWFSVILINQNNEIKKRVGNFSLLRK
ncbi:T9SS type B sorting domain-containing protein [Polaribacter aestuariivivens]|uniref:T9SS type B sorting domain-containing protein n=1 Tax=Polaribacter aestuariivivens TaxID=2304626 RepID=A0A5S3N674_9FLAO|nr:T9SS type B sorting domain-containing protein [Polaribacter aestuariivivens]TMM30034.1 T9SS type B sorting domain-containing protein [Polaribacter aestuariivivens]